MLLAELSSGELDSCYVHEVQQVKMKL